MGADGMYCPQNACYHDDTIEGCPNWSCITDPTGMDWHSYNGYCPQHLCYNDDTIQGCPGYIPTMCEIDSIGVDEEGNFCPDHICNIQPLVSPLIFVPITFLLKPRVVTVLKQR